MFHNKVIGSRLLVISWYMILILVIGLSIGFSSFYNELSIKDISATVRIDADIRISSVSQGDGYNEVYLTSLDYNVHNISGVFILPFSDSYIDFNIEITNLGNVEMGNKDILSNNDNLDFEILNYNLGDKLCIEEEDTGELKCTLGIEKNIIY